MLKTRILVASLALVAVLLLLHVPDVQGQCALCVTALENSPEGKGMASSFNNGILFLLAVPYAIFGTTGVFVFRAYRRKKERKPPENPYIPKPRT